MRRPATGIDRNTHPLIEQVRGLGADVVSLQFLGRYVPGFPDYLLGFRAQNFLVELKMPGEDLNEKQREWHERWRGQVATAGAFDDFLQLFEARTLALPGTLDPVLSLSQQQRLRQALMAVIVAGHGAVTIRVKNGNPRWIEATTSDALPGGKGGEGEAEAA